eukprot:113536-Amphidinium_carterae.1
MLEGVGSAMQRLKRLDLSLTQLSMSLPACSLTPMPQLWTLALHSNKLAGTLPEEGLRALT